MSEHKDSQSSPWTEIEWAEREGEAYPTNMPVNDDVIVIGQNKMAFVRVYPDGCIMEADPYGYHGLEWSPTHFITKEDALYHFV